MLDPFHTFPAPQSERFEKEKNSHKRKRGYLLHTTGEILIKICPAKVLHYAYCYSSHNRARDRIESAQNNCRQDKQAHVSYGYVKSVDIPEEGSAYAGCHESNRPSGGINEARADTDRKGCHFIVCRCLPGKPPAW